MEEDPDDFTFDHDAGHVQIDISPPEVEQLSAASAGVGGQAIESKQPVPLRKVEKRCQSWPPIHTFPGSEGVLRGRLARSTGLEGRIWSTTTASRNAFRKTAWTYSPVRGDRPAPFRPPLVTRSP